MLNIEKAGDVNGVSRCIQTICSNLHSKSVVTHRLTFTNVDDVRVVDHSLYKQTFIPLPQNMNDFFVSRDVRYKYWLNIYELFKTSFQSCHKLILHVHTLNLIEFAIIVRRNIKCRIVTHVHCWPWKLLYNSNKPLFMQLYNKYYCKKEYKASTFVLKDYEAYCYTESDAVVCVTKCMCEFIRHMYPDKAIPLYYIPNGLADSGSKIQYDLSTTNILTCIFVGSPHPSKGLINILGALNLIKTRCSTKVFIVGNSQGCFL